ncbi:ferredoxin [Amycolatopsis methanolica]|uniref:Ferredoxin n=1 Tax=Amycolatopsis methanolica 239 TaxID=1068978 RepID=A0A076MK89_AMYME|nr:ferredoxin [Amycolatopsis methanolica]AIJ21278.1 ferredoxin [Amycolatopsis methanolica 239]
MPYFIGPECIDYMDKSCLEECPVDCIYEGKRKLYINPVECIDCGACEAVCPVAAITLEGDTDDPARLRLGEDNARFFDTPLPGRDTAIGAPGGAAITGPLGVDTPLVAGHPAND